MNTNTKRDLHMTIAAIRREINEQRNRAWDIPKAMMTGQQVLNRTATVNCGHVHRSCYNEWFFMRREIAEAVISHELFKGFLARNNASAFIEEKRFDEYVQCQVRIKFAE